MTKSISVLLLLVAMHPGRQAAIGAEDAVSVGQIVTSWDNHRASIKTGIMRWQTVTRDFNRNGEVEVEFRTEETYEWGEGSRRRFHRAGEFPTADGGLKSTDSTRTDNGAEGWREVTMGSSEVEHPAGFINDRRWGRRELLPIIWHYGKAIPSYRFTADRMKILNDNYNFDGRACVLLEEASSEKKWRRTLVVDPQADYAIVEVSVYRLEGPLQYQFRMAYQEDQGGVWSLANWDYTFMSESGAVNTRAEAVVVDCQLNVPISEDRFHLEFPPGTVVYDVANDEMYVQKDTGERRVVTADERAAGLKYEEALATESGMGIQSRLKPNNRRGFSIALGVVNVVCLLAFWIWRRYRSSHQP